MAGVDELHELVPGAILPIAIPVVPSILFLIKSLRLVILFEKD
jgi:hypothetical protein